MWIVFGVLSVIFTILNWVFALRKSDKSYLMALCAISSAALAVLMEYSLVVDWVNRSDWAALLDVVPYIYAPIVIYVAVMIIANIIAPVLQKRRSL